MFKLSTFLWIKIIAIHLVIAFTVYIGISYVAPRIILKFSKQISTSNAADYGMRYDELFAITDDSLEIYGDFIYPFDVDPGDDYPSHSIIVLHPLTENCKSIYPVIKPFNTLGVNFITFDLRGHGRSEGHFYTLGTKESKDISNIIDMILEMDSEHTFGIYARGNSSNVALKAMSEDNRIEYGIVEDYYPTIMDEIEFLNSDDIVFNSDFLKTYILDEALGFLKLKPSEVKIDLSKVAQPLLLLSTPSNFQEMHDLKKELSSKEKCLVLFEENDNLNTSLIESDEGLYDCIVEFIELHRK